MFRISSVAPMAILLILLQLFTNPPSARGEVSQKEIDNAIARGVKYILDKYKEDLPINNGYELMVYTLIHGDVDPSKNKVLERAIGKILEKPLTNTYNVAITALAFHSLLGKISSGKFDKKKIGSAKIQSFQKRIAECGQWLVDSQLDNGKWSYGGKKIHEPEKDKLIETNGVKEEDERYIRVKPWENAASSSGFEYKLIPKNGKKEKKGTDADKKETPQIAEGGDNSNTQYGMLGIIAAQLSGCLVPKDTWERAMAWFESCQSSDGGFDYGAASKGARSSYGSMTTAGAVALGACYRFLGRSLSKEKRFTDAVGWLGNNFTVAENPKRGGWHFYYLYGLERVGAFWGDPKMGGHEWFKEGAEYLIKSQQGDGSWKGSSQHETPDINTCFAILFLKRATSDIATGTIDQK